MLGAIVGFMTMASFVLGYFMGRASMDDEKRKTEDEK